jgi:hypothetical protein
VQYAAECGGVIVSTDNYRDLLQENPAWRETIERRWGKWKYNSYMGGYGESSSIVAMWHRFFCASNADYKNYTQVFRFNVDKICIYGFQHL